MLLVLQGFLKKTYCIFQGVEIIIDNRKNLIRIYVISTSSRSGQRKRRRHVGFYCLCLLLIAVIRGTLTLAALLGVVSRRCQHVAQRGLVLEALLLAPHSTNLTLYEIAPLKHALLLQGP